MVRAVTVSGFQGSFLNPETAFESARKASRRAPRRRRNRAPRGRGAGRGRLRPRGREDGRGRQGERRRRDQGVGAGRREHGEPRAQVLERPEVGRERAGHGAQRVGAVEQGDRAPAAVLRLLGGPGERRQRPAHQEGGQAEHERRQREAHHEGQRLPEDRAAAGGEVRVPDEREEERAEQGAAGDAELQDGVEPQRPRVPVRPEPQRRSAHSQAAHEDGQHRGGRVGRRSEDQPQLAQPAHLVDERAEARAEEEGRQRRPSRGSRRMHAHSADDLGDEADRSI